ncbi:MAG TPA: phosphoribosylformylglycinamidine cyclo-ligase [Epulopiscium sp.]|nr:phosphoribosylformylglycinamidine cyclo-ligase [Candidatus Epulonipiscium sp.]
MSKITYEDAGVDVHRGYQAVEKIKSHVKRTQSKNVLTDIGGFAGLFSLDLDGIANPVLVSGTDGVGTKLKLAFEMDKHDTIGIDCVAMCVNDIICQGAKPLFFLDYVATGKIAPSHIEQIVKGIADGCVESLCSLIGGETAEMPGFYQDGEYDLAGFAVGVVDRDKVITGTNIEAGNVIIGLPSTGVHSNGYSLIRKLIEADNLDLNKYDETLGETYGEALMKPTKLYVKSIKALQGTVNIKGIAHITGGGFIENIPRMLPEGLAANIDITSIVKPPIYTWIERISGLDKDELYNTFNMGVGMIVVVEKEEADKAIETLQAMGEKATIIGNVVEDSRGLII